MADRVHPHDSPPVSGESQPTSSQEHGVTTKPTPPALEKPVPPPGTYVVQIPKDQIYRVPPPENARRQNQYVHRKNRRNPCCCCLCWLIGLIFILVVLLGIAAGVLYLVFRPQAPDYTVNRISVKGMNLTAAAATTLAVSPEFDVAVRANNPNDKIGIYYEKDSSVEVYYKDVRLCNGALPAFYQPSNNVTVFETVLKGSNIELRSTDRTALVDAQNKQKVPLTLKLRAPVKIKVGSVKTWKITVKVNCDITVNNLTAQAKVVTKDCDYGVDLW